MKKNINKIAQVGFLLSFLIGLVCITPLVQADTWASPTSAPPLGNVSSPINTGATSQFKLGPLGIGESSSTTTSTSTPLEVNGILSTNGLANFGSAVLYQNTHIGPPNTCSSCWTTANANVLYTRAIAVPLGGALPTYTAPNPAGSYTVLGGAMTYENSNKTDLAVDSKDTGSFFGKVFDKVGGFLTDVFNPSQAYASLIDTDNGPIVDPIQYGPCYGAWCNSSQYCDNVSQSCQAMGTTLTTGQADPNTAVANTNFTTAGTGADGGSPGVLYGLPTAIGYATHRGSLITELSFNSIPSSGTFTPVVIATTTSGSVTIYWHIGSASVCNISSANPDINWNTSVALNPAGFSNGYHTISFSGASPGSYTYTLSCNSANEFFNNHGSSTSVTVIVGDKYVLQTNGNANVEGYIVASGNIVTNGNFLEHNKRVCLEDGTDCPVNTATNIINPIDMGGSLDLGINSVGTAVSPYIDFHGQSTSQQNYNFRMINDFNGGVSFYANSSSTRIMYIDSGGNIYMRGTVHASQTGI